MSTWNFELNNNKYKIGKDDNYIKLISTSNYGISASLEVEGNDFEIKGDNEFTFSTENYVLNYNSRGLINGYTDNPASFYIYKKNVTSYQSYNGSSSADLSGWNVNVADSIIDGSKDFNFTWEVDNTYKGNSKYDSEKGYNVMEKIEFNWVTEIASNDWNNNGGQTIRNDWHCWGAKWSWNCVSGADWKLYNEMYLAGTVHAKINVSYLVSTHKIVINALTTSPIVNGICSSIVEVNIENNYSGIMYIKLGGENCKLDNIRLSY